WAQSMPGESLDWVRDIESQIRRASRGEIPTIRWGYMRSPRARRNRSLGPRPLADHTVVSGVRSASSGNLGVLKDADARRCRLSFSHTAARTRNGSPVEYLILSKVIMARDTCSWTSTPFPLVSIFVKIFE